MAKLPYIQLYTGDWLRDTVSGCSLPAQGLWLRMMFVMHDSERYGYLSLGGRAATDEWVASKVGCPVELYRDLLGELDRAGVPSRTSDSIIFSRRMVRDASERSKTTERQRRHRSGNGSVTQTVTPQSRPPNAGSSSSSSNSIIKPSSSINPTSSSNKPKEDDDGFLKTEWEGIAARLACLNVHAAAGAVKNAQEHGLTTTQVHGLIDHWVENDGCWPPGGLHWRISNGLPSQSKTDGWPPPNTSKVVADKQSANRAKQSQDSRATELIKSARKDNKTDDEIRAILKSVGLEWPK